jgi:hypothetical protein
LDLCTGEERREIKGLKEKNGMRGEKEIRKKKGTRISSNKNKEIMGTAK